MKKLFVALRVIIILILTLAYLFLCYGALRESYPGAIDLIKNVILLPGIIPLIGWVIMVANVKILNFIKFIFLAIFLIFYHAYTFAWAAHGPEWTYWIFQCVELVLLIPIIKLTARKTDSLSSKQEPRIGSNSHK